MIKITFTQKAWKEYCYCQKQDKKTLKRIKNKSFDKNIDVCYNVLHKERSDGI